MKRDLSPCVLPLLVGALARARLLFQRIPERGWRWRGLRSFLLRFLRLTTTAQLALCHVFLPLSPYIAEATVVTMTWIRGAAPSRGSRRICKRWRHLFPKRNC